MNPTCGSEAERLEPIMITATYCDKCGSDVLADPARPYVRCIKCDNLTTAALTRPTKPQFRPILERDPTALGPRSETTCPFSRAQLRMTVGFRPGSVRPSVAQRRVEILQIRRCDRHDSDTTL